jgi:hypothetical protein
MAVEKRDLFAPSVVQPPLGDGSHDDYQTGQPSARMDTSGAHGGLGQSAAGAADIANWHANQTEYGSGKGLGSYGYGVGEPDPFTSTGSLPADSNMQSAAQTGGTDEFVRRSGGGDDAGLRDSNLGAGGKSLAP